MKYFLLLLTVLTISSCDWVGFEDEETEPTYIDHNYNPEPSDWDIKEFLRGEWILTGGIFYVEYHYPDDTIIPNHFSNGIISNLSIDGSPYEFDEIVQYVTTWTFYPESQRTTQFWLDGDSIHPFLLTTFGDYVANASEYPVPSTYQQIGGSTRAITIIEHSDAYMKVRVRESEVNYQDWNVNPWSELTFRKVASW